MNNCHRNKERSNHFALCVFFFFLEWNACVTETIDWYQLIVIIVFYAFKFVFICVSTYSIEIQYKNKATANMSNLHEVEMPKMCKQTF